MKKRTFIVISVSADVYGPPLAGLNFYYIYIYVYIYIYIYLFSHSYSDCSWVETHFETRREKRQAEMAGLTDAKSYLSGVEAGDEVF